jgi:regulator of protease activity HflC (stomatin/prohibitin superfamily)
MRKNSKVVVLLMAILAFAIVLSGCTRVDPGHVGIKVNMAGSDRGVDKLPIVTGWVTYLPGATQVFQYPTFMQTATWTQSPHEGSPDNEEITWNTSDQVTVTADINLSYHLDSEKVPNFYVQFRSDDLAFFTHGYLRNVARDAFNNIGSRYSFDDVNGPKKEEILGKVRERINADVTKYGVIVEQFGFIGALRPPENIINSINLKTQAIQKAMQAENELREAEAQAKKVVANAEGAAQANERLARSISPQLLEWRKLEVTDKAVSKWDGRRPMVEGSHSGLLLNINPNQP